MHRIIKMEPVGNRFKITLDGELQFYLYKGEVRRLKLIKDNEISIENTTILWIFL